MSLIQLSLIAIDHTIGLYQICNHHIGTVSRKDKNLKILISVHQKSSLKRTTSLESFPCFARSSHIKSICFFLLGRWFSIVYHRSLFSLSFNNNFLKLLLEVVEDCVSAFLHYILESLKLMAIYPLSLPHPSQHPCCKPFIFGNLQLHLSVKSWSTIDILLSLYMAVERFKKSRVYLPERKKDGVFWRIFLMKWRSP